jgi:O-methyltransferase involved in polyketide biosynthesis
VRQIVIPRRVGDARCGSARRGALLRGRPSRDASRQAVAPRTSRRALDGITFVAADFIEPGLAAALAAAGHDSSQPTQFLCEGVLRYLPEHWVHELLRVSAQLAALGSELAVSISTRDSDPRAGEDERRRALAEQGEPVLTVPERDVARQWVADAGWTVLSVSDGTDADPPSPHRLLVRAGGAMTSDPEERDDTLRSADRRTRSVSQLAVDVRLPIAATGSTRGRRERARRERHARRHVHGQRQVGDLRARGALARRDDW